MADKIKPFFVQIKKGQSSAFIRLSFQLNFSSAMTKPVIYCTLLWWLIAWSADFLHFSAFSVISQYWARSYCATVLEVQPTFTRA